MTDERRPDGDEPTRSPKHWLIGDPLPSDQLEGQLLPKHLALPIFASDPLSSVAYAPQELLMILLVGGLAFLSFAPWVAAAVVLLLLVVVASYRQLIKAYPSGGGDYEVARKNIGEGAGVVVAAALLVDYILTVAVSVASGVDNIISAIPELNPFRVGIAVGFVVLLAAVNLRGVRESSKAFAIPTYLFIASIALHGGRRAGAHRCSAIRRSPRAPSTASRRSRSPRPASSCCCCAPSRAAAPPSPASRRSRTACPPSAARRSRTRSAPWSPWA